jgi:hypothetical protein
VGGAQSGWEAGANVGVVKERKKEEEDDDNIPPYPPLH